MPHDSLGRKKGTWTLLISKILWEATSAVQKGFVLIHGVQSLSCSWPVL